MKKSVLTISVRPTMCSALKETDISFNERIQYCIFHKEDIKMSKKKGRNSQIHLGMRGVDQGRYHRRG